MSEISIETMLQARLKRDPRFDGKFFVGIKTTQIFCLPSCKARQSKEENIEFFNNQHEAKQSGYRGCKRCHSETYPNTKPVWLEKIEEFLESRTEEKITEKELSKIFDVDQSTMHRKFLQYLETTPTEYHRALKLEKAKNLLEEGENISEIIHKCGFKSISGFRTAFIKKYGYTPRIGGFN